MIARSYFRSLFFAINAPSYSGDDAAVVLWWLVRSDHHLRIVAEYAFSYQHIPDVAGEIKTTDRRLGIKDIAYTVANPTLFSKRSPSFRGIPGEYVSETFARYDVSLMPADDDDLNGWSRVHELLRDAPDGDPWLTIDSSCEQLVKQLRSAMSDEQKPEELASYAPALHALRYGAMSRPAPEAVMCDVQVPIGSPAYVMRELRAGAANGRMFGRVR